MRVILLHDIGGVGKKGDVKDIVDGYAQNRLIPQGLVVQATPERLKTHEAAREKEIEEKARAAEQIKTIVQSLEGKRFELAARATEKGGLFKSIDAKDVATLLKKNRAALPESAVVLSKPIKTIGEHAIELAYEKARAHITLAIKATE